MKLYSALYDERDPFGRFEVDFAIVPEHLEKNDGVLVLWGGEDISPSIYGETPNKHTHATITLSKRDRAEIALAKRAFQIGMPVIGVCRGAQLLCAMNGGKLVQHVNNHSSGTHSITTEEGKTLRTNSIHHQMMRPSGTYKLVAWATEPLSDVYVGEGDKHLSPPEKEPEVVFWPDTKSLGIQGHPEYLTPSHEFVRYCDEKIKEYLKV